MRRQLDAVVDLQVGGDRHQGLHDDHLDAVADGVHVVAHRRQPAQHAGQRALRAVVLRRRVLVGGARFVQRVVRQVHEGLRDVGGRWGRVGQRAEAREALATDVDLQRREARHNGVDAQVKLEAATVTAHAQRSNSRSKPG